MTNEELNRRLRFCANNGIPYSDKLWALLIQAWDQGYEARKVSEYATAFGLPGREENWYRGKPDRKESNDR